MAADTFNQNIDNGTSGSGGDGNNRIGGSDDYINKMLMIFYR